MSPKFLISFSALAATTAFAAAPQFATDRVVIKIKPGYSDALVASTLGGSIVDRIPQLRTIVVKLRTTTLVAAQSMVISARRQGAVQAAHLSALAYMDRLPNDPKFVDQYGPKLVNAPASWDLSIGRPTVTVAVIDSGIDLKHEDFVGKLVPGYDYADNDADPTDDTKSPGHGTHVAGIVGAASNNGIGIAGMAWNVMVMPMKVFPKGEEYTYDTLYSKAIVDAADKGVKVCNLSLGGYGTNGNTAQDAINYAWQKGMVIVASAGNSGTDNDARMHYPSDLVNSLCVAASDSQDRLADFSNYGKRVDLSAPGVDILSTFPGNAYVAESGTSMSAPMVAGAVALMFSYTSTRTTNAQIIRALKLTSVPISTKISNGRIDLFRAMQMVKPTTSFTDAPSDAWTSTPLTGRGQQSKVVALDRILLSADSINMSLGAIVAARIELPLVHSGYTLDAVTLKVTATATSGAVTQQIFMRDFSALTEKYDLMKQAPLVNDATATIALGVLAPKYLNNGVASIMIRALRPRGRGTGATYNYGIDAVRAEGLYRDNSTL